MPLADLAAPALGHLRQHGQPGPDVLLALGVVGGQGGHGGRPVGRQPLRLRVEGGRRVTAPVGVAADLVKREQPGPPVEGGVLDALGQHRAGGLLEPHDELARPAGRPLAGRCSPSTARPRSAASPRSLRGSRLRADSTASPMAASAAAAGELARVHVGAVDRERGEHLDQHGPGLVLGDAGADAAEQPGQPRHLGRQRPGGDLALGRLGDVREPHGGTGSSPAPRVNRAYSAVSASGPGRVEEEPVDQLERVVPGRARAGPVGRQRLVRLEDLLHHHPGAVGRRREPGQVAARVGQPVRMVDPEAVHQALGHQPDDDLVGRVEHGRVLDPDPDQRGDVEEPPPVELGRGVTPPGQPVVLRLEQARASAAAPSPAAAAARGRST